MSGLDAVILNEIKKLAAASGGGGVPINSSMALNVGAVDMYTGEGQVWLKTGVISTEVANYPEAHRSFTSVKDDTTLDTTTNKAMVSDGVNLYIINDTTDRIYKRTFDLGLIFGGISTYEPSTGKTVFTWNSADNHFIVGRGTLNTAYKVSTTGTNLGSITFAYPLYGICYANNYYFGIDNATQTVKRMLITGADAGLSISPVGGKAVRVAGEGSVIYILCEDGMIYSYDTDGVFIEKIANIFVPKSDRLAMAVNAGAFYLSSQTQVKKYANAVGDPVEKFEVVKFAATTSTNTEKGNPIYTRIL